MKALEEKILKSGKILPGGVLYVGSFLNHMIDAPFCAEMAKETAHLFSSQKIDKVLTIEASGIAYGILTAVELGVPLVFAKKSHSSNVMGETYNAGVHSFTHGNDFIASVPKDYLDKNENVLIVDDFLATGEAIKGLINIVNQAGANVAGIATLVEKVDQGGGNALREAGYHVESLAMVDKMTDDSLTFVERR